MWFLKKLVAEPARTFLSVNDIESAVQLKLSQIGKLRLRETVRIAVVDDQHFSAEINLRNNGYRIDTFRDLNSLQALTSYPIILCDLQGVGAELNPELQGAHLIRELKTHYPEKFVVAYTGVGKTSIMSRTAQDYADTFLKKDADLDAWLEVLDQAIGAVTNPIDLWKEFRKRALDSGMTPIQLAEMEDEFVNRFWGGNEAVAEGLLARAMKIGLHKDLRAVVQSLVASLIFKAIIG